MPHLTQYSARVSPLAIESVSVHLIVAAGSMALLWLAFPAPAWGWVAHLALVPMTLLAIRSNKVRRLCWTTYLVTSIWWLARLRWMTPVTLGGYVVLSAYLALYVPIALLVVRWLQQRLSWPMVVILPMAWISLEQIRGRVPAGGFGWFSLAQTQVAWPLTESAQRTIQIADLFGEPGISLLVAMTNGATVDLLTRPFVRRTTTGRTRCNRMIIAVAAAWFFAIVGSWLYGQYRINETATVLSDGPTVVAIQTNVPQDNKNRPTLEKLQRDFGRMVELTREAVAMVPPRPQRPADASPIIVWPETMVPGALNPEAIEHFKTAKSTWLGGEYYHTQIQALAREMNCWLVVGGPSHVDWFSFTARDGRSHKMPGKRFNSAYLYRPSGIQAEQRYDKCHLVPFGEYIPWVEAVPWLKHLFIKYLSPYEFDYTLQAGEHSVVLEVQPDLRLATPICFEDTIGRVCRKMVYGRGGKKRSHLLANLTNDGWFAGSSEGPQHLQLAALRCVELRIPMVRSVNTGFSGFIDSLGRIGPLVERQGAYQQVEGFAMATMQIDSRRTLYGRIGDVPVVLITCLTAVLVIFCRLSRKDYRRRDHP